MTPTRIGPLDSVVDYGLKPSFEETRALQRVIMNRTVRFFDPNAIANGWKPGAISHRLLRKLNEAKENTSTVHSKKLLKKPKKRTEEQKPALIVAKRNGEFIVEMQVYENGEASGGPDNCKPLIYKIASPDRQEKLKRRARRTQWLIEQAQKKIFATDRYNPDMCEQTCGKAYAQALGVLPEDLERYKNSTILDNCVCPQDMESDYEGRSCEDASEDIGSDYSSADLDWEIHFTPPNINRN